MVISLMVMFKVNKDGVVDLSVMLMVADLRPLLPQCLAASQTGFHGYVKNVFGRSHIYTDQSLPL